MYQSQLFHNTLREAPAEAEVASHQLLLRGGYIKPVAAGIYNYTPLGLRILRKIEQLVREEMEKANAQEVLLPVLQPVDLWKESGRYDNYGPELMKLEDRHQRGFALGPTHEEVITTLIRQEINSYRKLPITLFQIQTKFRDERRPRFGLLRSREFLMKDAYSFDTSWEGLDHSYQTMKHAYERIFTRLAINFRAVEADGGTIGGEGGTHEFMALADIGEDTIVSCSHCQYAANIEKAEALQPAINDTLSESSEPDVQLAVSSLQKVYTPHIQSIEALTSFFQTEPSKLLKTIIFIADEKPVAVVINGQYEVNELKVKSFLKAEQLELADADYVKANLNTTIGYVGPIGLTIPLLCDYSLLTMTDSITGANEEHYHVTGVDVKQHLSHGQYGDFRQVVEHEACPRCQDGKLIFSRGIEMGHIFKLGTKYSIPLKATFLNKNGQSEPIIMGCYGIGISRLLSAILEQHHQEQSIVWPHAVTPYAVHVLIMSSKDEHQQHLLSQLTKHNHVDMLIDDREERAGVKFKDADLIGIPYRLIIGKDAEQGLVEWLDRKAGTRETITIEQAIKHIETITHYIDN